MNSRELNNKDNGDVVPGGAYTLPTTLPKEARKSVYEREFPAPTSQPTMREQAEKAVGHYREQAEKHERALAFFRAHPEFDEFVLLIRSGVISIYNI